MPDVATWDDAIEQAEAPPAPEGETEEVAPAPAEEAEAPTPEGTEPEAQMTDDAAPSGTPAREEEVAKPEVEAKEEKKPEEDIQPDDPEEVKALPTASARRWARQRDKEARVVDDFRLPDRPISGFAEKLEQLSPSRYHELTADIFDSHGDQYLQNRYGIPAEELGALVEGRGKQAEQPAPAQLADDTDPDYDPLDDPLIPESAKRQLREAAADKAERDALKARLGDIEGKVSSFETKEQERERLEAEAQARAIETELFNEVFPVVGEAIKEYGLEENKDDPEEIAGLKEAARELLLSNLDPVFMEDAENKKAVDRVKHFASKRERDNVLREADALKVRSRAAAQKVRESRKLSAILTAIERLSEDKATKITERGKGRVPVPATVAPNGGQPVPPRDIRTWDDAFAAAGQ